jgi:two-component system, NarL family, nitrate/nitrite response regulator NarL
MSLHKAHEAYYALASQDASQIPTVLMCGNSLTRAGIKHILSETCFQIHDDADHHESSLSPYPDAEVVLVVLEATRSPSEMARLIPELKAQREAARVVVLAENPNCDEIVLAYQAGAAGVLHTAAAPEVLIKSLELIALGERVFPAEAILSAANDMAQALRQEHQPEMTGATIHAHSLGERNLSGREQEILRWLMEGAPNKIIARKLGVAEATVKVHIKAILRKIRAQNRTQAAMWATTHLNSAPDVRRE